MLYFPQLMTGATAQYPFSKVRITRTAAETYRDSRIAKLADPGEAAVKWRLGFTGLAEEERLNLEAFFTAAEGRLNTFTFLDPTDNLLLWSEDLNAAAWTKGPFLELTANARDPMGGERAALVYNSGGAGQSIQQTIQAPGWYHYCFSLYVRAGQATRLRLFRATGQARDELSVEARPNWARLQQSGTAVSTSESVSFGIHLEPGDRIEVYGLQVEAQPSASVYRKTTARSGVYTNARFDQDCLAMTAEGPDEYSCSVRIVV